MRRVAPALLALTLAACATERRPEPPAPVPTFAWQADESLDAADLDATLEANDSSCTVVVQDGRIVHEAYWNGGAEDRSLAVFSVTKSFTALLIGIAQADGLLDLDDPVAQYVPQWRDTDSAHVTIRQVLSNTSGREWSYETDYEQMAFRARDKTDFAIGLGQEAEPGETWRYNNAAIQVLAAVLLEATGSDPGAYARAKLIDPLGMADTRWGSDRSGHATTYAGVTSTCRDLARFGLMVLQGGVWEGERIVPESFLAEATERSSDLNAAYGLLWWVNDTGTVLGPLTATGAKEQAPYDGRLAPDVPADAFWALGFGNQIVAVVPEDDVVAVRLGARPHNEVALSPGRFTADVLDLLD